MPIPRTSVASVVAVLTLAGTASADEPIDTSHIFVKKAIADTMTPEQLQAYKERLARNFAQPRPAPTRDATAEPDTPGGTCSAATPEIFGGLPYGPVPDTTVGAVDDYDLPPDTTSPTCTAAPTCTGAGPAGSLPRGAIYTGTGTGPDRAWRISCPLGVVTPLTITATPTAGWDLALIVYHANCSNSLADCVCVDDTGVAGQAESVQIQAFDGQVYFVVVDGYSTGGTPPGPSGPYTLTLSGSSTLCWPVELQKMSIE